MNIEFAVAVPFLRTSISTDVPAFRTQRDALTYASVLAEVTVMRATRVHATSGPGI